MFFKKKTEQLENLMKDLDEKLNKSLKEKLDVLTQEITLKYKGLDEIKQTIKFL